MTDKDLDKRLTEKLRDYKATPPEGMFARIEESLATVNEKAVGADEMAAVAARKRPLSWYVVRYCSVAAVLCGLILSGLYISRVTTDMTQQELTETPTPYSEAVSGTEAPHPTTDGQETAPATEQVFATTEKPARTIIADAGASGAEASSARRTGQQNQRITATELRTDEDAQWSIEEIGPQEEQPITETHQTTEAQPHTTITAPELPVIKDPWADILANDARRARRRGSLATSLYAGNFGTSSGDVTRNDPQALARSDMKINIITEAPDKSTGHISPDDFNPKPYPTKSAPTEVSLKHKILVTAGFNLSYPITPRLSVISGLNYSYLYSVSTETSQMADAELSREIHYLGIPLSLAYTIYDNNWMNFYVRGGGAIEKAVYAKSTLHLATDADSGGKAERLKIRGVQPSVDLSLGVNFKITKNMSVYAEPGVAYYFENLHQPVNYRTENPTSFSFRMGLKMGL